MKKQIFSDEKKNYQARAEKFFQNSPVHYNCAQSVLMAFAKDCGISEEKACQLGRHFGSGMKMGECCGAITGGLMVIGMLDGGEEEYRRFMKDMRDEHDNLVNCSDLLRSNSKANQCDRIVSGFTDRNILHSLWMSCMKNRKHLCLNTRSSG